MFSVTIGLFSNQRSGRTQESTLKPFVGMLYTVPGTETDVIGHAIGHRHSPRGCAHAHEYRLDRVFFVAARPLPPLCRAEFTSLL